MNQVMISNLMVQIKNQELNENLVRHMVLRSLVSYEKKYGDEYGQIILAYDSKHYWRKDYFPYYKFNRKKDRQNSGLNWGSIFDLLNKIRDEIKDNLSYIVIETLGAEADDAISVLCRHKKPKEKVLILSGDKDFIQLHKYPGVYQYNPVTKQYLSSENPYHFIKTHIIKGDKSDGIPNFLSDDDTFATQKRQKPISQKKLNIWIGQEPSEFCSSKKELDNYTRNKILIDMDYIPEDIEQKIIEEYNIEINKKDKDTKIEYFQSHQLNDLTNSFYFHSLDVIKDEVTIK